MKFCNVCGAPVVLRAVEGDSRPRSQCTQCHTIHYQNPLVVAGTLPYLDGKVLLCLRAIEPRKGFWTLPAGFVEQGETLRQAALRETWEEARAEVDLEDLYTIVSVPRVSQIHFMYRAHLRNETFHPGEETSETALFAIADIPWPHIAFPSVLRTLEYFCADYPRKLYSLYHEDLL